VGQQRNLTYAVIRRKRRVIALWENPVQSSRALHKDLFSTQFYGSKVRFFANAYCRLPAFIAAESCLGTSRFTVYFVRPAAAKAADTISAPFRHIAF